MAWRLKLAALATCSALALGVGGAQASPKLQLSGLAGLTALRRRRSN